MNQLYEVNVMTHAMQTFYVSAETAEDAGKIAAVLYNSGVINLKDDMDVRVEAMSINSSDYYDGRIEESGKSAAVPADDKCKNCVLYAIYNSVGDVSVDKG